MKLMFIDETGDEKFKDYLGLCIAITDSKFYPLLKQQTLKILTDAGWGADAEFKGRYLFSATSGVTEVEVQQRVVTAHRLLDLNASEKKGRLRFTYARMNSFKKANDYLTAIPELLKIRKVLPKAPKGAGKNLISVTCDHRDDVRSDDLHRAIGPVLEESGYVILERVQQVTSAPEAVGLMFADLVAYLMGRVDAISNDSEFFAGLDQTQLAASGKVRKLQSSTELVNKIKNLDLFIRE
jgi:hypothetical protein